MKNAICGLIRRPLVVGLLVLASASVAQTTPVNAPDAQGAAAKPPGEWTVLTNSPAETLASFRRMSRQLQSVLNDYENHKTRANSEHLSLVTGQIRSLIDLSHVAGITKRDTGSETVAALLDIFGRIGYPDPAQAPDTQGVKAGGYVSYSVPGTPLHIVRISEGRRSGEWLFEARTVETAPSFLKGISGLPVDPQERIKNWRLLLKQLTGPMIPDSLVAAIPDWMKNSVFGAPIWKGLAALIISALTVALLVIWLRILPRSKAEDNSSGTTVIKVLGPVGINLVVFGTYWFLDTELNLTGALALVAGVAASVVYWTTFAWGFWLIVIAISERIMERTRFVEGSIDANMMRLCARIFGIIGCVIILAFGAQTVGVPVLSLLAGVGIGGIAVALAVRPTLENLIGGMILFLDKPIRVGEYCSFGDKSGTVEKIGARSTQIRALDRTTITVPNSRFADMEIINWSRCDRLHINQTFGLRYETDNDQLQYILAKIREMFHAHPKIDGVSARAMFVGYSETSLNITVMAYVNSPYWSEYFAVREDAYLRIKKIIEQSGTYYAAPTRTVYFQRDQGLDKAQNEQVKKEVQEWRDNGEFPFPLFSEEAIDRLTGQIEYPVPGSPAYAQAQAEIAKDKKKEGTGDP